jgi:uncharacterized membrane protein YidH (DUF202 family)
VTGAPPESQPDRTRLAWRRTALALAATALLAVALVVHRNGTAPAVLTLVPVLVVAVAGLALVQARVRELSRPGFGRLGRSAAVLALLVAAYAGLAVALVLLSTG